VISVDDLKNFLDELKDLRRAIKAESVPQIGKKALRERSEQIGTRWFTDIGAGLTSGTALSAEIIEKYAAGCARLIRLSGPSNQRSSYIETLDGLIKPFRNELILPVQQGQVVTAAASSFDSFFSSASADESEYLQEAISCAKAGFLRAAVVLGWSAAIDRIHRKIEQLGFARFNSTSAQMAALTKGRYKRFNQAQNVGSISELREVFDTIVLQIIEGMQLIDSNQYTRLRSCFDMRCHGAHPGDAPVTEYNLLSFFSDIDQIVLNNPRFGL
jgi:hypothetical protein